MSIENNDTHLETELKDDIRKAVIESEITSVVRRAAEDARSIVAEAKDKDFRLVENAAKRVAAQFSAKQAIMDAAIAESCAPYAHLMVKNIKSHDEEIRETVDDSNGNETYSEPEDYQIAEIYELIKKRAIEREKLIDEYEKKLRWKLFFYRLMPFRRKNKSFDEENIQEIFKLAYLKSQK